MQWGLLLQSPPAKSTDTFRNLFLPSSILRATCTSLYWWQVKPVNHLYPAAWCNTWENPMTKFLKTKRYYTAMAYTKPIHWGLQWIVCRPTYRRQKESRRFKAAFSSLGTVVFNNKAINVGIPLFFLHSYECLLKWKLSAAGAGKIFEVEVSNSSHVYRLQVSVPPNCNIFLTQWSSLWSRTITCNP